MAASRRCSPISASLPRPASSSSSSAASPGSPPKWLRNTRARSRCAFVFRLSTTGNSGRSADPLGPAEQMATRTITPEERTLAHDMLPREKTAMQAIEHYDQARVDRLCQAIGWAAGNETSATRLANMSVDESGMGSREAGRRSKVLGILRDALRQQSMGVIETIPERGIVKYAKPAGVIASLIPSTNPELTPPGNGIYALKCKDAVIFSPHPMSKQTTLETVRIMRAALKKQGAPEDLFQCVETPSIPLAQELMSICDLTIATGGMPMVRAAYSSGKPAYGVGAGNSTMLIDETADIEDAARNTRISKTSDNGSGWSAGGKLVGRQSIYTPLP